MKSRSQKGRNRRGEEDKEAGKVKEAPGCCSRDRPVSLVTGEGEHGGEGGRRLKGVTVVSMVKH